MPQAADYTALELITHDRVTELRLSRPDLLNRFDMQLHDELTEAMERLAADDDVLAVVWTSTGDVFSAGGDFAVMLDAAGSLSHRMALLDKGRRLFRAVADFPKPLVVALAANSYGLASSLVLCADAVVSCEGVSLSDPHVRMGLAAGDGGCVSWPSAMGMVRAKRHLLTGDEIDAAEAFRLGAVSDIVDDRDAVAPKAFEIAQKIASLPPLAVQLTKRTVNRALSARADEVLDAGFYLEGITFGSDDLAEAVAAFKERRPGRWTGN
jgi:enoyl-CoA hydratase